ncbi:MAG TPA: hypothetical protein VGG29_16255, partial [Caulobacteraceae bacterium]
MPSQTSCSLAGALAAATLALPGAALAHGIVGDRFFPATLVIDDPAVADELTLPEPQVTRTSDTPPATEVDIGGEWD